MRKLLCFLSVIWSISCCGLQDCRCNVMEQASTPLIIRKAPVIINQIDSCQQACLLKRRKRQAREAIRRQKQVDLEEKRRLRLQQKCEKVALQIEQLNQRYKRGYTARQRQILDRKLVECQIKKLKFCQAR